VCKTLFQRLEKISPNIKMRILASLLAAAAAVVSGDQFGVAVGIAGRDFAVVAADATFRRGAVLMSGTFLFFSFLAQYLRNR
jgi:hypothetical protein